MRKREDIERDGTRKDMLTLEVLLDIRDLLMKQEKLRQEDKYGFGAGGKTNQRIYRPSGKN